GSFPIGNAVDDEPRPKYAVAAGKDSRRRGHQRLRIDCNQTAGGDLNFVLGLEEIELWRLANGHDDRVTLDYIFRSLIESGIKPPVLIEDPFRVQGFKTGDFAALPDDALWPATGPENNPFSFSFFDFFKRCRHFLAPFEADDVDFASAETQS